MINRLTLKSNNPLIKYSDRVNSLYESCHDYLDKNFSIEINNDPFSKAWELIICKNLLNANLNLEKVRKNNKGPDFVINNFPVSDAVTCIECIAPEKGDERNRPDDDRDFLVIRLMSAISDKLEQVLSWEKSQIKTTYVVLAINYSKLCINKGSMEELLGEKNTFFVKTEQEDYLETTFTSKLIAKKLTGKQVQVGSAAVYDNLLQYYDGFIGSNIQPFLGDSSNRFEFLYKDESVKSSLGLRDIFKFIPSPFDQ